MHGNDPTAEVAAHCAEVFAAITDAGILHPEFRVGELVNPLSHAQTTIAAFIRLSDFSSDDLICELSAVARNIRKEGITTFEKNRTGNA